jgi:hypothetical protein
MTHANDRELLMKSMFNIAKHTGNDVDLFIHSFLVWMDGMSGNLDNPPKSLHDIACSKNEMMHDEWVKKYSERLTK